MPFNDFIFLFHFHFQTHGRKKWPLITMPYCTLSKFQRLIMSSLAEIPNYTRQRFCSSAAYFFAFLWLRKARRKVRSDFLKLLSLKIAWMDGKTAITFSPDGARQTTWELRSGWAMISCMSSRSICNRQNWGIWDKNMRINYPYRHCITECW